MVVRWLWGAASVVKPHVYLVARTSPPRSRPSSPSTAPSLSSHTSPKISHESQPNNPLRPLTLAPPDWPLQARGFAARRQAHSTCPSRFRCGAPRRKSICPPLVPCSPPPLLELRCMAARDGSCRWSLLAEMEPFLVGGLGLLAAREGEGARGDGVCVSRRESTGRVELGAGRQVR